MVATGRPAEPEQLTVDESDYGFEHGAPSTTVDTERIDDEAQVYPVGGESSTAGGYFGRTNDTSKPRKPGPTVCRARLRGRASAGKRAGDVDDRTCSFGAADSEQLQQQREKFHQNSFERGGFAADAASRALLFIDSAPVCRPGRGLRRGAGMSVGGRTDTREELDEDCQEVTEFSGHATGSLLFEGCADRT